MMIGYQRQKHGLITLALVGLLVATSLRVWLGPLTLTATAQAQIPDSGLQLKQIIDEVRRTNALLVEIKQLLVSRTFNVRIEGADNPADKRKKPRP